jgi:hypothetical protein
LRTALGFGDNDNDPAIASKNKVRKCAMRCGYPVTSGEVLKRNFDPAFKYFCHVLILCLSSKRGGTDALNEQLVTIMASLLMNMKLNITRIIWNSLIKAARDAALDFILYPRFVQLLLNANQTKIVPTSDEIMPIVKIKDSTVLSMKDYNGPRPADAKFWGAMVNKDYVCPEGDAVSHDNSDCDLPVVDVEQPAKKNTRKRKADDHIEQSVTILTNEPPKQKRFPSLAPRPILGPDGKLIYPETPASSSSQRRSSTSVSARKDLDDLISRMDGLTIEVTKVKEDAQQEREEAANEKKRTDDRIAALEKLVKRLDKRSERLKRRNRTLKDKIRIQDKLYDKLAKQMIINREGTYKYPDAVSDDDDRYPLPPSSPIDLTDEGSSGTDPET